MATLCSVPRRRERYESEVVGEGTSSGDVIHYIRVTS